MDFQYKSQTVTVDVVPEMPFGAEVIVRSDREPCFRKDCARIFVQLFTRTGAMVDCDNIWAYWNEDGSVFWSIPKMLAPWFNEDICQELAEPIKGELAEEFAKLKALGRA